MSENLALRRSSAALDPADRGVIGVWHEVGLYEYFHRNQIVDAAEHMRSVIRHWCKLNVAENHWRYAGVTQISYRVYFYSAEDAVMFRLRFGI